MSDDVSRERVVQWWRELSKGNLDAIEREPWLPGYPASDADDLTAAGQAAALQSLDSPRAFYDELGEERADRPCKIPGCNRGSVKFRVYCRPHHYEHVRHDSCPFDH